MTAAIGAGGLGPVFPNQLLTAVAGQYNGHSAALCVLPQLNQDRWLTRILLTTTLSSADVIGGNGGAYWNLAINPPVQAPFYLFMAAPAVSNMIDLSMIGSVNVGEFLAPVKVPRQTELWCVWDGVLAASAPKCQATLCLSAA